jgi:UDP-glucose 4-epimerase
MKLFVTGGTGFIGSHFVERALADHELFCVRHKERPCIPLSGEPTWIYGDLAGDYDAALKNCKAMVHFAAVGVSPQKAKWEELFTVNVAQSAALWRRAVECGVRRFLICGSCFEYGRSAERFSFIPPDAPLEPVNGYGASKAAATVAACALALEFGVQVTVLRPFHVYGEGQHPNNLWPSLRHAAAFGIDFEMTAGEQVRDFIHVESLAKLFLHELECGTNEAGAVVRNIGTGMPIMLKKFAEHWWSEWRAPGKLCPTLPYRPNEIMRLVPQI